MTNGFGLWEFLSRDVAVLGGPSSPILSWLGAVGIVLLFLWHVRKLKREVTSVQQGFERVHPMLMTLAHERKDVDRERFTQNLKKASPTQANQWTAETTMRSDVEDLRTLEAGMEQDPMFRDTWAQYRMTLILERVPWFLEARIFSTRRAEEVFTQEALFAHRVNLSFYSQFPSLVTGLGLLLTFLALFVGLGKLHAQGSEIVGIQGLINGLAGKFLTSIVGLMVANLFTFIEKPQVARLMSAHHRFLGLIDQLFPRKTMEQMLEPLTSIHAQPQEGRVTSSEGVQHLSGDWGTTGLAGPLASLTTGIQSLTKMQEEAQAETRRMRAELPGAMRGELHAPLRELTDTIQNLTKVLTEMQQNQASVSPAVAPRSFLWNVSSDSHAVPEEHPSEKTKSWPRWPRRALQRRTG